jgi:glutathione synthase/RimK-type ligase-like ATP-grasp enzyme
VAQSEVGTGGASVHELFERAVELHAKGRDNEAKLAYLDLLEIDSTHLSALNNLGTLLFNTGYRSAARTAYRQAVAHHPNSTMSRVNLANALYDNNELYQAREHYEAALRIDPECAQAHQGLAYVLDKLGDERAAQYHRDLGYKGHATAVVPYRGTDSAIPVLLLVSALGGNVNTDRFLDDHVFFTTKLFAEYYDPAMPVPFHSFVFNAIGDAELCPAALNQAAAILARTNAPVVNAPEAVLATGRVQNARRLGTLPGVRAPRTQSFQREALVSAGAEQLLARSGFTFPLLLRSPGFHTGHHFVKIDHPRRFREAAARLPGEQLLAIEFLDARSPDGNVRKYRVIAVDGKLYPLHLAIAPDWKVHYHTAPMKTRPEFRSEESAFLDDMAGVLGARAMDALQSIVDTLRLEYAGVDFALGTGGEIVLFEANATMLVPAIDPDPVFAYRRAATDALHAAVREMLLQRHRLSIGTQSEAPKVAGAISRRKSHQ